MVDKGLDWYLGSSGGTLGSRPSYRALEELFKDRLPPKTSKILYIRDFPKNGTLDDHIEAETIDRRSIESHKGKLGRILGDYLSECIAPCVMVIDNGYDNALSYMRDIYSKDKIKTF